MGNPPRTEMFLHRMYAIEQTLTFCKLLLFLSSFLIFLALQIRTLSMFLLFLPDVFAFFGMSRICGTSEDKHC